jgi:hypothetical protein
MERPYVELSFKPNAALVSTVRRFVSEFYTKLVGNSEATSRLALATHELLENAVKYASDGETRLRIDIDIARSPKLVTLEMRNRTAPSHIAAIERILGGIASVGDPSKFYFDLIVETETAEGSGLGLARICAEADMRLACRVEDGDVIVMTGTAEIADTEARAA